MAKKLSRSGNRLTGPHWAAETSAIWCAVTRNSNEARLGSNEARLGSKG